MNRRYFIALAALLAVSCAAVVQADEIRLKDGTKLTGTIVGFEHDAFRVETSYGFALIQKDKVAEIIVTPPKPDPQPQSKPQPKPDTTVSSSASGPSAKAGASASVNPAGAPASAVPVPGTNAPQTSALARTPVEPAMIHDEIRGKLYINQTYGFEIYKPPSWELLPAARKALPDAVAALGTADESTLLVIGKKAGGESLEARAVLTEHALSGIYDNYRLISTRHATIAGFAAVQQRARGTADEHDWSVTLVTLIRGDDAFTLLGMTWADSDLIQLQENVIAKVVNSLAFTK